jgi:hypothetical protein
MRTSRRVSVAGALPWRFGRAAADMTRAFTGKFKVLASEYHLSRMGPGGGGGPPIPGKSGVGPPPPIPGKSGMGTGMGIGGGSVPWNERESAAQ